MGIELTPAAKVLLAKQGYDPVMGARPLRRTIQREIEDKLSEKILFGELQSGHIVVVDTEGEGDEAKFRRRSAPVGTDGAEKNEAFTFVGTPHTPAPDAPPQDTVEIVDGPQDN